MACFVVPASEAVVTKIVEKATGNSVDKSEAKSPFIRHLNWLSNLLIGGSVLLAFEHVWHGEVVPWFPFLTAMENSEDTAEMLHEMGTVGVGMAVLITVVWIAMVLVASHLEKTTPELQKN